jgi:uncharacterized protein YndB with AHSA1/START domain
MSLIPHILALPQARDHSCPALRGRDPLARSAITGSAENPVPRPIGGVVSVPARAGDNRFGEKKGKVMTGKYVATSTITIEAPTRRVWSVLTSPDAIKEFMFGTEVLTDWSPGGPIVWRGMWEGKEYEDRGKILELEPGRRLVVTHFSPLSGQEDAPENYHTLTWTLEDQPGTTVLTLSQDNNATADEAEHSKGMWDSLVAGVKTIAERE